MGLVSWQIPLPRAGQRLCQWVSQVQLYIRQLNQVPPVLFRLDVWGLRVSHQESLFSKAKKGFDIRALALACHASSRLSSSRRFPITQSHNGRLKTGGNVSSVTVTRIRVKGQLCIGCSFVPRRKSLNHPVSSTFKRRLRRVVVCVIATMSGAVQVVASLRTKAGPYQHGCPRFGFSV